MTTEKSIYELKRRRDNLIRDLWLVLNKLSYDIKLDNYTKEDLDLWSKVTEHSAIQDRLSKGGNKEEEDYE